MRNSRNPWSADKSLCYSHSRAVSFYLTTLFIRGGLIYTESVCSFLSRISIATYVFRLRCRTNRRVFELDNSANEPVKRYTTPCNGVRAARTSVAMPKHRGIFFIARQLRQRANLQDCSIVVSYCIWEMHVLDVKRTLYHIYHS